MKQAAPTIAETADRLISYEVSCQRRDVTVSCEDFQSIDRDALVSVVTVCFNSASFIRQTIESVLSQSWRPLEYIIIDGGSTDGTVEIIKQYAGRLAYWHSAPDAGISDAFNLGITASRGFAVALVNADDWLSSDQMEAAVHALKQTEADFVFGALDYHAIDGSLLYRSEGDASYIRRINYEMPEVNHPTLVARRSTYEKVGLYDPNCRIAMDYDWFLRATLCGAVGAYDAAIVGHLRRGGISSNNIVRGLREVRDAAISNGIPPIRPHFAYYSRVTRLKVRLQMARVLPPFLVDRIHRWINPKYRPAVPGGASK